MQLSVLGSSSTGNCYILQNNKEALIIEAGIPYKQVLEGLGFNSIKVVGCLVTHEHGDHAKYASDYSINSINVLSSQGTIDKIHAGSVIDKFKPIRIGSFTVLAFDTQHDCAEPIGFLISHVEIGVLLFATDTYFLKYKFEGLTNVMIECNYSLDTLNKNVELGNIHPVVRDRTLHSHMSLQSCIKALQANNLTQVNNIILLHLSSQNGDPKRFKQEVELSIGKSVAIARRGLEININRTI